MQMPVSDPLSGVSSQPKPSFSNASSDRYSTPLTTQVDESHPGGTLVTGSVGNEPAVATAAPTARLATETSASTTMRLTDMPPPCSRARFCLATEACLPQPPQ